MSKQLVINASAAEEVRVAIIEDGRLVDLDIDSSSRTKQKGNIYKGIVANVEDSLEAAFIEFGDDKQAFLALSEVRPALYPAELRGQRRPKISDVLKRGQELVVQVTKDEIGNKGAAVTTYLSLPGRYVVLMHSDDSGGGVSRKIEDEAARRRARDMLGHLDVPDGMAVIIRTAGMNRPMIDLYRDLKALAKVWEQIDRGGQLGRAPTLLYREPDLVVRTIRDYLAPDIGKILIDSEDEFEEVKSYFEERSPDALALLERYEGRQPLFEKLGIEGAIEELFERQVKLPAGGYLIIDQTEALVAIDVNSGKSTRESDHEATVYKTNLEAAREVARQLRLRDLGGIIVVDFIDMEAAEDRKALLDAFTKRLERDRARTRVGKVSSLGLVELTRKRTGESVTEAITDSCPMCAGRGRIASKETVSLWIERDMRRRLHDAGNAFLVECHPAVVESLIGADGESVEDLEHELNRGIYLRANFDIPFEEYSIRSGWIEEFDREFMGFRRAQVLECNVRRSSFESTNKIVGWTDNGYYMELLDGVGHVGHRVKVCLQDIRRSFAVADVILPGTARPNPRGY